MTDTPASGPDMAEDDIDLASLDDEELTAQRHDDLYDGLADEVAEGPHILMG
ncbi:MAG: cobalamin-binding protein, partial [Acidimicrobiaceae bacterium]|nr:cobalamin-binding protein [Acidimicrobiaceae bacterium]